jgi:Alkylmercury lyase
VVELTLGSLHHAILRTFVECGRAPTNAELCERFRVESDEMTRMLQDLAAYHGVVLHPHAPEVWIAHPFSAAPTLFCVRQGERRWWSNCAWCALGASALVGGDSVSIDTVLGADGAPMTIHVDGHRVLEDLVVHFPIPMTRAWDNVVYTCSTMLAFASAADVDDWSRRHSIPRGDVQPIQRVHDFARDWYGRHLDEDWRKWTTEEARQLFSRYGLKGPIWDVPMSAERF